MSWQAYIDDHLMVPLPSGSTLQSAAIVGQDGGVWAKSDAFPAVTADEIAKIVLGCDDNKVLGATGVFIGGIKFQQAYAGEGIIRGRTKFEEKQGGCCIKKTATALVIGIYEDPVQPGDCNGVIEAMGDYLSGMSY